MNRISYQCTNIYKQLFLLAYMFYLLLCSLVIAEIVIFDVPEYDVSIFKGLLIYSGLMIIVLFIFRGYKFFYTVYDDKKIIYHNVLLRRTHAIDMDSIKEIVFSKKGIKIYTADCKAPSLYIPFFRGGIVEALDIDKFYKTMKNKNNLKIVKEFKVLPGYGKSFTFLKVIYIFLTVYALVSCLTPLVTVIVLLQNFA